MDQKSYEDGKSGNAMGPNADVNAYRAGQAERDATTYKPNSETGESQAQGGGWAPITSSGPATAIGFGHLIMAPFMYMIYPAGGIVFLGIVGIVCAVVLRVFHIPQFTAIFICFAAAFPAFFAGLRLEQMVSPNGPYRFFRQLWRAVTCTMSVFAYMFLRGTDIKKFSPELVLKDLDKAGGALVYSAIALVILFWLVRRADRIYFPVESVRIKEELAAAQPRGIVTRILMSLVWFLPVFIVMTLVIPLALWGYFDVTQPEENVRELAKAFYKQHMLYVYVINTAVWFVLSAAGILPGTGRKK